MKVIVAGFATFVQEFLEEESVQEEEDVLEEFLPLFYANNLLSERHKAVRIEGYAETVVPNYNLSEFRSHFRISADTLEQLVVDLGNCPELPTGPQHGSREPISVEKHLLITLWFLGNHESIRSISDRFNVTKSSVFTCVNRVCKALKNNITGQVIVWPNQARAQVYGVPSPPKSKLVTQHPTLPLSTSDFTVNIELCCYQQRTLQLSTSNY